MFAYPRPHQPQTGSAREYLVMNEMRAQELLHTDEPERPSPFTAARNRVRLEYHVTHDQPPFPHGLHFTLSVLTAGLWLPVYWLAWLGSARRRYQRGRRAVLRADGLL